MRTFRGRYFLIDQDLDYNEMQIPEFKNKTAPGGSYGDYYKMDRDTLRRNIIDSGIYSREEIERIEKIGCNRVIANLLCSSPFSGFRYYLALEHTQKIITGLKIIMEAVAADSADVIYPADILAICEAVENRVKRAPNIYMRPVKDRYPLSFPQFIYRYVYSQKKDESYFDGKDGLLIIPAEKLIGMCMAVEYPEKSGTKPVAVINGNSKHIVWGYDENTIGQVLDILEIEPEGFIIAGDPLWGRSIFDMDEELRDRSHIFILQNIDINPDRCIGCGKCIAICPAGLRIPHSMKVLQAAKGVMPFGIAEGCLECGLCGFVCPGYKK